MGFYLNFCIVVIQNKHLSDYFVGKWIGESTWGSTISKLGQFSSVFLCDQPWICLTLVCCPGKPTLCSGTNTTRAEALVSWAQYLRNPISTGLEDMILKISVVAGIRTPNTGHPRGAVMVSSAGPRLCRISPEQLGSLRTLVWPCFHSVDLPKGRAALMFAEDHNQAPTWSVDKAEAVLVLECWMIFKR